MKRGMMIALALWATSVTAMADCSTPVTFGRLPDYFAWIRFESCAAPHDVVGATDAVLDSVRTARGLLIDLRHASGMTYDDARKIVGRFMNERNDWFDSQNLKPRGLWQYAGPVVVLVDSTSRWPVQALATYLNHLQFSLIVGTKLPAPDNVAEWKTGIVPDVVVDLAKTKGDDPIWTVGRAKLSDLEQRSREWQLRGMNMMFNGGGR